MTKPTESTSRTMLNATSQMAFAVSICALAAAAIGAIVNHWLTGWFAIGGMTGVGLFYLAIGLLNLRTKSVTDNNELSQSNSSQRHAAAENLYEESRGHLRLKASDGSDMSRSHRRPEKGG